MSLKRLTVLVIVPFVALAFGLGGCGTKAPSSQTTAGGASDKAVDTSVGPKDSAGQAIAAAGAAIRADVPDAVMVAISSGGVVLNPPPASWEVLFASPSTGHLYTVGVEHGKARAPKDIGEAQASLTGLAEAVPYKQFKVGSDKAYEIAAEALAAAGGSTGDNVVMGVFTTVMPEMGDWKPGVWSVSFTKGTSTSGMRTIFVDARTGEATEKK